jgi:SulP family sulfate permease
VTHPADEGSGKSSPGRDENMAPPTQLPARVASALQTWARSLAVSRRDLGRDAVAGVPGARAPVVVLRLRGRTALGVTSFKILTVYARQLEQAGGRLFLSGVTPDLLTQFRRAEAVESSAIAVFPEAEVVGESSAAAYAAGLAWREEHVGKDPAREGQKET